MMNFVRKLKKEVDAEIHRIEAMDANNLKKSLEASRVLGTAFNRLKTFIIGYNFCDDAEEIQFFKHIKPSFCSHLIYYRKVYNIEMNRPVGTIEAQRAYLNHELDQIHSFQQKRQDFYRYLRSGASNLDSIYFMRDKTDNVSRSDGVACRPSRSRSNAMRMASMLSRSRAFLLNAIFEKGLDCARQFRVE